MASLLQVIVFLSTLVSCSTFAAEIQLSDKKLDCSTVQSALLSQFPEICSKIHDWSNTYVDLLLEERIRTVEECTCHLVRHNIAWQYMMTHEVETLFNAIKVVLDGMDNEEANLAVPSESIMFQGEEGESLQFWDKLNALNNNADDYKEKLFTPLTEAFAKLYYRTSDMNMPYLSAKGDLKNKDLRDTFTEICNSVYIPFARFGQYFANLRQMAQNTRFVYRVATFDEDLYKIISVVKVCQAMAMGDDIELYQ